MKKKILFLGNSQVVALSKGLRLIDKKIDNFFFISIAGGGGPKININSRGYLVFPKNKSSKLSNNLKPDVSIEDFDKFVLSGVGLPALRKTNKEIDLTEFYNLVYQYENDCLKAALEYNKAFYTDGDLKPEEELFFSITIIPFTKLNTTNLN